MLYLDLDNFKAYNDVYGFLNGDEIIKFTARTIVDNIDKLSVSGKTFVGHIGGDDFVAIVSAEDDYEAICQAIIAFKLVLPASMKIGMIESPIVPS